MRKLLSELSDKDQSLIQNLICSDFYEILTLMIKHEISFIVLIGIIDNNHMNIDEIDFSELYDKVEDYIEIKSCFAENI